MRLIEGTGPHADAARRIVEVAAEEAQRSAQHIHDCLGPMPYGDSAKHAQMWAEHLAHMALCLEPLVELGYGNCPACSQELNDWYCHTCGERFDDETERQRLIQLPPATRRALAGRGGHVLLDYVRYGFPSLSNVT